MKKYIAIIMLGLSTLVVCHAQKNKDSASVKHHEFYESVGVFNDLDGNNFTNIFTNEHDFRYFIKRSDFPLFTPSIGYRYWFNERLGIGAHFAYDKGTVRVFCLKEPPPPLLSWVSEAVYSFYYYTMAVDFNCNYYKNNICQLYGNVGVGTTLLHVPEGSRTYYKIDYKQTSFFFNVHVSPFGVRVGSKTVGGFAEIGYGYKGLLNLGLYVKF